ncbi:MAG: Lrp/AsnC family transcriptional regulator [Rhodospirillaceae bacterium]|nr:Lrp/AsnC family transcriptional regulator [Rhodospirillaceae bacterium]MBL6940550.1 Lrp/AsnC family transcriptional regulator [Rhodospirillales bacterium]
MKLDDIDFAILKNLQMEGRLSNAELAERIHLSPSACLRRVRLLEESGIIEGYTMLINQAAIGKRSNIFVEVSLTSQSEKNLGDFEAAVSDCPEIMECYLMAGGFDYLLRVAASDAADYERIHTLYLSRLPNVLRIQSNFALRTVCKKSVLPIS